MTKIEESKYVVEEKIVLRNIGGVFLFVPCGEIPQIRNDQFILTNRVGAEIWEAFKSKRTTGEVVSILADRFDVEYEVLSRDVQSITEGFIRLGLVKEVQ